MDKKQPSHAAVKAFFDAHLSNNNRAKREPVVIEVLEFLKHLYHEHVFGDKNAVAAMPNIIHAHFNHLECKYINYDEYEQIQKDLDQARELLAERVEND